MYIILFFLFIPSLFFSINKYKVYFLILFSFLIIFFHDLFFSLFQNFLLLNHNYENIAGRLDIWIISLNLFYENIYSGIGFFVSPLGYSVPANFPDWATIDNPSFQIHKHLQLRPYILQGYFVKTTHPLIEHELFLAQIQGQKQLPYFYWPF